MNNIDFFKTFQFNILKFDKYHFRDNTDPPVQAHYFGCIIKGTAKIISKSVKLELMPNEIFYIPKGLRYQSHWFPDDQGRLEFYSFGFELSPTKDLFILQKIRNSEKATSLFSEICQEVPFTNKSIGKLYDFFGEVANSMLQRPSPKINPVIEKAIEYMSEYPTSKISDIAKYCNISESNIYIIFKNQLNKTPNDVRREILCEKAVLMLKTTDKTIQEISDTLSFSSTSYFRKVLRNHTGKTPLEIRKESVF